jgi:RHH-type proline utilization regulon transcriptional repressor/proline dehydrogenase/delta 1-pyrroline-5-carboxylate dehydrogenase
MPSNRESWPGVKQFFQSIRGEAPSVINKGFWTGKVMDWAIEKRGLQGPALRVRGRPALPDHLRRASAPHRGINFAGDGAADIRRAQVGRGEVRHVRGPGRSGHGQAIRSNIEGMAKGFIIGQTAKEAVKSHKKLARTASPSPWTF